MRNLKVTIIILLILIAAIVITLLSIPLGKVEALEATNGTNVVDDIEDANDTHGVKSLQTVNSVEKIDEIETILSSEEVEPETLSLELKLESQPEVITTQTTQTTQPTPPSPTTTQDSYLLAQMVWGEARGITPFTTPSGRYVSNTEQMAACIWTVFNRIDAGYYSSISEAVKAKGQYTGYKSSNPINPSLVKLAEDCISNWKSHTGRVLPEPTETDRWCWFYGTKRDGQRRNVFRSRYKDDKDVNGNSLRIEYDWELPTIYEYDLEIDYNERV